MGPIEIIPAAAESTIPLAPDPLPRNLTMCAGVRNRFIKTMSVKTRLKGTTIFNNMPILLLNATDALAGLKTKKTA